MDKYYGIADEELICRYHNGEHDIMDYIMEKYKNLVRKNAKAMFLLGGDSEDLIQEGMIGLFKAVRDYKQDKEATFYSFADLCITRQIYSAVKAANRQKHKPLNTYISLYAKKEEGDGGQTDIQLIEQLQSMSVENPETLVISRENAKLLHKELERNLSKFEQEVLFLYLSGNNYMQIGQLLDKNSKSIDNALQRIKAKMSKVLRQKNG